MKDNNEEITLEQANRLLFEKLAQEDINQTLYFLSCYRTLKEIFKMSVEEIFIKFPTARPISIKSDDNCQEFEVWTPDGYFTFTIWEGRCVENTFIPYRMERTKRLYEKLIGNNS